MRPIIPLTRQQRTAIDEILDGHVPRLFLPDSLQEQSQIVSDLPDGSNCIVPPTYTDVSGEQSSALELFNEAQTADMEVSVYELSSLNVLLGKLRPEADFQHAALDEYVRPEFRNPVHAASDAARSNHEFIVNSVGSMIALKAVIGVERPIGPMPASKYKVGDLILRANRFVSGTRFDGTPENQTEAELAAEIICTWDLTNPRDIGYEPARISRMLELIDSSDSKVSSLRAQLNIKSADLRFAGLPIIDFLAVVFGLSAQAQAASQEAVLKDPRVASINCRTVLSEVKLPQIVLDTFLQNRSISLSDLRQKLTPNAPWTPDEYCRQMESSKFRTDFLPFRQFPLIRMSETILVIPSPQFLSELMFSGLFFEQYFGLAKDKRDSFSNLWGRLFELSNFELLEYYYPPFSGILTTNLEYEGGEIDAMLDFGEYIVLFEFKHFLLTHDVKYSRNGVLLEQTLKEKLLSNQDGKPKAIRQLITIARNIRSGRIKTLKGKASSSEGAAAIYPVIVVDEPCLEAPLVNVFCDKLFRAEAGDLQVKPLTMMSVHEFEKALPMIGSLTWRDLFEFRFYENGVRATSVHQAICVLSKERNLEYKRNDFRLAQFKAIYQKILARCMGDSPRTFDLTP